MSFSDLEAGPGGKSSFARSTGASDDNVRITNKVSQDIVRINGNITTIQKLIDSLGTKKDTPALRSRLHNLTENTCDLVKDTGLDVKAFPKSESYAYQKLSTDFARVLGDFQRVQRLSVEKQREYVIKAKQANETLIDIDGDGSEDAQLIDVPSNAQIQLQEQDVEYNDSLIQEREVEIREIESSINELGEIFRDLGTMVVDQGAMLDNIESNVSNVSMHVRDAADQLTTASRYQRQARKRMCCLLLVLAVIAAIVILAVLA